MRPTEESRVPCLISIRGTSGPSARGPTRAGFTACQMSTKGVRGRRARPPALETASATRFLRAWNMWSARMPARCVRGPRSQDCLEVVDALGAGPPMPASARSSPHMLHKFGIMASSWRYASSSDLGAARCRANEPEFVIRRPVAHLHSRRGLGGLGSWAAPRWDASSQKTGTQWE